MCVEHPAVPARNPATSTRRSQTNLLVTKKCCRILGLLYWLTLRFQVVPGSSTDRPGLGIATMISMRAPPTLKETEWFRHGRMGENGCPKYTKKQNFKVHNQNGALENQKIFTMKRSNGNNNQRSKTSRCTTKTAPWRIKRYSR